MQRPVYDYRRAGGREGGREDMKEKDADRFIVWVDVLN